MKINNIYKDGAPATQYVKLTFAGNRESLTKSCQSTLNVNFVCLNKALECYISIFLFYYKIKTFAETKENNWKMFQIGLSDFSMKT